MFRFNIALMLGLVFCLSACHQASKDSKSQSPDSPESFKALVRPVVDTVGFAQYGWQMDSIINRLNARIKIDRTNEFKAIIAPHDDYKYAGEVTYQAISGIHAKTLILFGVAHKAKNFHLQDRIVFGSFTHWNAPYGKVKISGLQKDILKKLPAELWIVHDSMQRVEHSLEALIPFLQHQNREMEIVPIIVPYMNFEKMVEISESLSSVLSEIMHEKHLTFGPDLAIVISNDALHYGDVDWGGKNMAPFGTDSLGNEKARKLDLEIIDNCLKGDLNAQKVNRFVNYTVQEKDYREYKWTWCGRYSVPLGLLTANRLNERIFSKPLNGQFLSYANSIDHPLYPVEDLRMGITAPANPRHWVSYVGMGYK